MLRCVNSMTGNLPRANVCIAAMQQSQVMIMMSAICQYCWPMGLSEVVLAKDCSLRQIVSHYMC